MASAAELLSFRIREKPFGAFPVFLGLNRGWFMNKIMIVFIHKQEVKIMDDEKLCCPICDSPDYEVRSQQKEKQPGHFYLTIELRVCKNCGNEYRTANNGSVEYYYS